MINVQTPLKKVLPSQLREEDFIELVTREGVRGAARTLGVSAQAVSAHLKRLGLCPVLRPHVVCDLPPLAVRRKLHPILDNVPLSHVVRRVEAVGVDMAAVELCCTRAALLHFLRRLGCRVVFQVVLERCDG